MRTVRDRLERKARGRVGEREFLHCAGDVAQTLDGPDDRALDMETLQAGKIPEEFQIRRGVTQEPQLDFAASVPQRGEPLQLGVGLGPLHAKTDAGLVQGPPRIEPERRVVVELARALRMSDVFTARRGAA